MSAHSTFEADGYGPGGTCPFCGQRAETTFDEVAHMEAHHPEVIERRLRDAGLPPRERPAMDLLARLDQWSEREGSNVLITRRLDLSAPDEWSVILTSGAGQFTGYGMSPSLAIERALENANAVVAA